MINKEEPAEAIFISHAFPPGGGSGVQRVAKFVKYLPEFGIKTHVITAKNFLKKTSDESLLEDFDEDTKIIRTISLDPMFIADMYTRKEESYSVKSKSKNHRKANIFKKIFPILIKIRDYARLPDQYIGWLPTALIAGRKLIKQTKKPVIIASLPIYTVAIIGYLLSRTTGVPLILDFRDSWVDDPYLELPTKFHRWLHGYLERKILNHADHLIVYGDWLENIYNEKYPNIPNSIIMNGYDAKDFSYEETKKKSSEKINLLYVGTIFQYHEEFIELFFSSIANLPQDDRRDIEIKFAGEIQLTTFDELTNKYNLENTVSRLGYLPHNEVTSMLVSADALIFTIPKGDISSYTGKVFEYLAARRPIISFVCEEGCCANLLKDFGHGEWIIDYEQSKADYVLKDLKRFKSINLEFTEKKFSKIERKNQAHELSKIINEVVACYYV